MAQMLEEQIVDILRRGNEFRSNGAVGICITPDDVDETAKIRGMDREDTIQHLARETAITICQNRIRTDMFGGD